MAKKKGKGNNNKKRVQSTKRQNNNAAKPEESTEAEAEAGELTPKTEEMPLIMNDVPCKQPQKQQQQQQEMIQIVKYNSQRDGEAVGILWADGLLEMFPPLFVETILHPKVISVLVALEGFLIPLGPRLLSAAAAATTTTIINNTTTTTTTTNNPTTDALISSWLIPAMILPTLLVLISCFAFLIMIALRIHLRWSKKTRIETSFTSSSSSSSNSHKEIIGQWVVLQRLRSSSPQQHQQDDKRRGGDNNTTNPLGCVTLYREEEDYMNKDDKNYDKIDEAQEETRKGNTINNSVSQNKRRRKKVIVWMSHLTVNPSFRRQGWGNKLALQAETKAKEIGATTIRILVGNTIKSRQFWLHRGYKVVLYPPPRWTLLGHESIYMELDLMDDNNKHDSIGSIGSSGSGTSSSSKQLIDMSIEGNPKYKGNMIWVSTRSQAMFLN